MTLKFLSFLKRIKYHFTKCRNLFLLINILEYFLINTKNQINIQQKF